MALEFKEKRTKIELTEGAKTTPDEHSFTKPFKTAHVVLRGFKLQFDKTDNPTKLVEVGVQLEQAVGSTVRYNIISQLEDNKTGRDKYSGHADVLIIAEVPD